MEALQLQSDRESYRIIALRRDRTELLLIAQENGLQFPSVEIPRWERVAGNLISAVKRIWGCEAVCSFTLEEVLQRKSFDGRSDQIMECWGDVEMCTGNSLWVPICSLSQHEFVDSREYAALEQFLTKCNSDEEDATAPFAKCGWFHDLQSWIAEMIRPLGLRLNGSFRQFNASPSFSLIRFETCGPAIWFKAAGEPNRHEFGITLKLAELFPNFLPKIIATRADWNGWLCFEAEGSDLGETREISLWETTAAILARLQIESVSKVSDITVSGARDLSTDRPSALVHPFFAPDRCAFLDWAEGYVGNPFLSFQYLLEHFRRTVAADSAAESRLISAYAGQWETMASRVAIDEGLRLSRLLAVFAYAAGTNAWRDRKRLEDPLTAGHLRSLTRRMTREANQLSDRRSLCLC